MYNLVVIYEQCVICMCMYTYSVYTGMMCSLRHMTYVRIVTKIHMHTVYAVCTNQHDVYMCPYACHTVGLLGSYTCMYLLNLLQV